MHKTYYQILGTEEIRMLYLVVHIPRKGEVVVLDKTRYKVYDVEYEFDALWHEATIIIIEKL